MDNWPFDSWLKLAVVRFGLSPAQFWAMSYCDWMTLIGRPQTAVMSAGELNTLVAKFPDLEPDNKKETHD